MSTYVGPTQIACENRCDVPAGYIVAVTPVPRHAWGDVAVCPHEGCDRALLVVRRPDAEGASHVG